MATSTEPKTTWEDDDMDRPYSVEDEDGDDSDADYFTRVKPHFLRTSSRLNAIIEHIHPDIIAKSHQSNLVLFPPKLENCTVLDLGCGVGRDVYILSKLVGPNGRVIGMDLQTDQLTTARQHIDYHMKKFNLTEPNVEFVDGDIEHLEETGLKENSFDVVVSNSVINYNRNKKAIIENVCKILKHGGEFHFSDVFVNRAIPKEYQELLAGEYIGGALCWEDLILYASEAGFTLPRLVTAQPVTITNDDIQKAIGNTKFVSAIFRCFKLPSKDIENESFIGPIQLTYETPVLHHEDEFFFDNALSFKFGELMIVNDPSIAFTLSVSRYKDNFAFDPVEQNTTTESTTVIEVVDDRQPEASGSEQTNNSGIYRKTTTTTTTVTVMPEDSY